MRTIVIAANFTAELLEEPLRFWTEELELASKIAFAPYNQAFQQLLDPTSLFGGNQAGVNVVLIRLEDWWRGAGNAGQDNSNRRKHVERNADDLVNALEVASQRTSVPFLVVLCPAGREVQDNAPLAEFFAGLEKRIAESAQANRGVQVVTSSELTSVYPVPDYEDLRADEVGHVPYTQEFFNALGTLVARRFYRLQTPPHKVIVLDCDNTLWRGVCGEDGTQGVKVDLAARALQEFVIAQRNAGMVLCLSSKNNEEDVWKVFAQNPGMVLRREHIAASRINWLPKSENLRSLAAELKLGLDSFILLDDSAMECAEVEARCPQVLALQVPQEAPAAAKFFSHVWAFDHLQVTEEDRQRSELYAQNSERETLRKQSMNLDDFLAGLELHLEISPMQKVDVARVAQLTQRTNQFNFTTIRRSENEIEKLCGQGNAECVVVKLRDRFGDYGTVGAMIFTKTGGVLDVDSVLLSCRALGRRVEHRMLAHLGTIAQECGIAHVRVNFAPTQKNKPAQEFLQGIGAKFEGTERTSYSWEFAAHDLVELPSSAAAVSVAETEAADTVTATTDPIQNKSGLYIRIATQLSDVASISRAVAARRPVKRRDHDSYVAPGTPFEEFLASAWMRLLHIDRVGVADNFFDLGGQSLSAMQIAFKIEEEFYVDFSLDTFLQSPVLADQALRLEEKIIEQADPRELEKFLDEIENAR
jgi:FkbH-like protein